MADAAEMNARHAAVLGELTTLALDLARQIQADAMAAEDPQVRAALADKFHKVARSVRQSLALEARLHRDVAREEAERRDQAQKDHQVRVSRRELRLANTLEELLWTEAERPDFKVDLELATGIVCHVGQYVDEPDFLTAPFEAQCRRIALDAGIRPDVVERFFARPAPEPPAPPPLEPFPYGRTGWSSA
jgi:hypothetical protein